MRAFKREVMEQRAIIMKALSEVPAFGENTTHTHNSTNTNSGNANANANTNANTNTNTNTNTNANTNANTNTNTNTNNNSVVLLFSCERAQREEAPRGAKRLVRFTITILFGHLDNNAVANARFLEGEKWRWLFCLLPYFSTSLYECSFLCAAMANTRISFCFG